MKPITIEPVCTPTTDDTIPRLKLENGKLVHRCGRDVRITGMDGPVVVIAYEDYRMLEHIYYQVQNLKRLINQL